MAFVACTVKTTGNLKKFIHTNYTHTSFFFHFWVGGENENGHQRLKRSVPSKIITQWVATLLIVNISTRIIPAFLLYTHASIQIKNKIALTLSTSLGGGAGRNTPCQIIMSDIKKTHSCHHCHSWKSCTEKKITCVGVSETKTHF